MQRQTFIEGYHFQRGYIDLLVGDIPEERMTEMPGDVGTHPAWQIGHMACSLDGFIAALGGEARFDDDWKAKFGMGSEPKADPSAYPSKQELLDMFDERRAVLVDLVANATEAQLATPMPDERSRAFFGTIGRYILFGMLSHESMHCGQLATWRKAAGMPQALSNIDKLLKQTAGA